MAPTTPSSPTKTTHPGRRWLFALLKIAVILLLGTAAYTWLTLSWSYSKGERAGYVQKISQKGWVCKTWEGELAMVTMPGTLSEKFTFTVPDDSVVKLINESMGHRVVLTYEQHTGIPTTCFGETGYFVRDVQRVLEDIVTGDSRAAPVPLQPVSEQNPASLPKP
ncbi:MAG: hypothetical protein RIR18_1213 [Pseudomonadota bacterium]|jgi:hypothetical protein